MLPNAVLRALSKVPRVSRRVLQGFPPVKEPLSFHCSFPFLAVATAVFKTKPACIQLGLSFFCDHTLTQCVYMCNKNW